MTVFWLALYFFIGAALTVAAVAYSRDDFALEVTPVEFAMNCVLVSVFWPVMIALMIFVALAADRTEDL